MRLRVALRTILFFFILSSTLSALGNEEKRDFHAGITAPQKKDIAYIVKTLANGSLTTIWKNKSSLEKAGDRIDPIHPLQFFCFIFQDEELKVGIRNIKKRGGWVKDEFFNGTFDSLSREHKLNNLSYEHVCHISSVLGIDADKIYPHIEAARWSEFIDTLIELLPRNSDADRYNI